MKSEKMVGNEGFSRASGGWMKSLAIYFEYSETTLLARVVMKTTLRKWPQFFCLRAREKKKISFSKITVDLSLSISLSFSYTAVTASPG
jgi:hypothetical protein